MPFGTAADSEAVRKHVAMNRYKEYERVWGCDEQALEEIWVHSVMTNIEAHWDYIKHKPKQRTNYLDFRKPNQHSSKERDT